MRGTNYFFSGQAAPDPRTIELGPPLFESDSIQGDTCSVAIKHFKTAGVASQTHSNAKTRGKMNKKLNAFFCLEFLHKPHKCGHVVQVEIFSSCTGFCGVIWFRGSCIVHRGFKQLCSEVLRLGFAHWSHGWSGHSCLENFSILRAIWAL